MKIFLWGNCYLNNLKVLTHSTPGTPKSIGFLCCPGRMCEEGIFELLIGNEKVTDGQTDQLTDRPTSAKQYALSSSKGGIKTKRNHFFL